MLLTIAFVLWKLSLVYRWGEEWIYREMPEETRAGGTLIMEGRMTMVLTISLDTVRLRREVETVRLGMTLYNITPPPPLIHKLRVGFEAKVMDRNNEASQDTLCP